MPGVIARLSRIVPLLVLLALAAAVGYVVIAWLRSPRRAKEILIRAFLWATGGSSVFFALATLYALFEQNWVAAEIALTFLVTGLVGLAVTLICRHVFLKNNPQYRERAMQADVINPHLLRRVLEALLNRLGRR